MAEKFKGRERQLVKLFEKRVNKSRPKWFTRVDQDSPQRQFKSGWDLLVIARNRIAIIEAKHVKAPVKDKKKLLRPFQAQTLLGLKASESDYFILEFTGNDPEVTETVTITGHDRAPATFFDWEALISYLGRCMGVE